MKKFLLVSVIALSPLLFSNNHMQVALDKGAEPDWSPIFVAYDKGTEPDWSPIFVAHDKGPEPDWSPTHTQA